MTVNLDRGNGQGNDLEGLAPGLGRPASLACWLTTIAVLVWLAVRPTSFEQRWPTTLPAAMSLELYQAARKAAARPSFCAYPSPNCIIG
jgi:hypothetical protein